MVYCTRTSPPTKILLSLIRLIDGDQAWLQHSDGGHVMGEDAKHASCGAHVNLLDRHVIVERLWGGEAGVTQGKAGMTLFRAHREVNIWRLPEWGKRR